MTSNQPAIQDEHGIETGIRFLTTLFDESDTVLFRPIETWSEGGKKRSRVGYKYTDHPCANIDYLRLVVKQQLVASEEERFNVFFGVRPRVGDKGRYDHAWQIRTARAGWADLDDISIDAAYERVASSQLPMPSVIVNSGNGAHLCWLLDEPYLIDDVGDPLPVEIEWVELATGRKKPREYVLEDGDHVYLDQAT